MLRFISRRVHPQRPLSSLGPHSSLIPHAPPSSTGPFDRICVVAIPVTSQRSYIYCNHQPSTLSRTAIKKVPWIVKIDAKLAGLAHKGWNKIKDSPNYVNVRITRLVYRLLNTISYHEHCITLFPSKSAMFRELQEGSSADSEAPPLRKIPVYVLSAQLHASVHAQLEELQQRQALHWKNALICAVGIPLSLPFALVPIVPNVPGIYLSYRLYCNVKALIGTKHLEYLLGESASTSHLQYTTSPELLALFTPTDSTHEILVLSSEKIDALCNQLKLHSIRSDLEKAMRQEQLRLEQGTATDGSLGQ